MGEGSLQVQGSEVGGFPPSAPSSQGHQLPAAEATFSFISTDPPAWAAAAAMPSKFSRRQLRETGQSFQSFLLDRGLDMETDRERLRTIYNRDFKARYGPAHPDPEPRGPARHQATTTARRGPPSRPGRGGTPLAAAWPVLGRRRPAPAPCPCPASAARVPPALCGRASALGPRREAPGPPAPGHLGTESVPLPARGAGEQLSGGGGEP